MSAVDRVLETLELLEEILLQANMQDVLRMQRINKTFHTLINTSLRLQQKLFFRAVSPGSEVSTTVNKLLCAALSVSHHRASGQFTTYLLPMDVPNRHDIWHSFFYLANHPRERLQELPPGSWSRMLLINPPVHERIDVRAGVVEWRKPKVLLRIEGEPVRYKSARKKTRQLYSHEKPAKLRALHRLIVEMRKVSRACRGVKDPQASHRSHDTSDSQSQPDI